MLAVKNYPSDYVDTCQTRFERQLAHLEAITDPPDGFLTDQAQNLVVVLEHAFGNRMRGAEGKDGNPLNEVRMLADSVLTNDGVLAADNTIRYKADRSVSGLDVGDPIDLPLDRLRSLGTAFFDTIRERFPAA